MDAKLPESNLSKNLHQPFPEKKKKKKSGHKIGGQ